MWRSGLFGRFGWVVGWPDHMYKYIEVKGAGSNLSLNEVDDFLVMVESMAFPVRWAFGVSAVYCGG